MALAQPSPSADWPVKNRLTHHRRYASATAENRSHCFAAGLKDFLDQAASLRPPLALLRQWPPEGWQALGILLFYRCLSVFSRMFVAGGALFYENC